MALWLAAIPALWLAKKAYDVITEDDTPTASSSPSYTSSEKLNTAKRQRTSERRREISSLVDKHRSKLAKNLARTLESDGSVFTSNANSNSIVVAHKGIGDQIQLLTDARSSFTKEKIIRHDTSSTIINLLTKEAVISKALKKADEDYGEFAGIDAHRVYSAERDPYLIQLKKRKQSLFTV
ncbi:hypothetical protein LMH73_007350 [Vibrio splendidus]|nr:hypothetical protein [Vibrio splendidus]MCC4883131.1 hypothetical protein [Vibrio splendidus]